MSNDRYKRVKSGNSLENVLYLQNEAYEKLMNKIKDKNIYNNYEIQEERKKLYSSNALINKIKQNLDIKKIRNNIVVKNKTLMEKEVKDVTKNDNIEDSKLNKSKTKSKKDGKTNTNQNIGYIKNVDTTKTNKSIDYDHQKLDSKENNSHLNMNNSKMNETMNNYTSLLKTENDFFKTQIHNYKENLNKIEDITNLEKADKIAKLGKNNLKYEEVKAFNYHPSHDKPVVVQVVNNDDINVNLLVKQIRNNKINNLTEDKDLKDFVDKDMIKSKIDEEKLSMQANEKNFCNLIKKEISGLGNLKKVYSEKKLNLDKRFQTRNIESKEENSRVFKGNINEVKDLIKETDNVKKNHFFKEYYRTAYEKLKEQWKKVNEEIDKKEALELEHIRENRLLVNEIRQRPRVSNYYEDEYSKRPGNKINDVIKKIDKMVNNKLPNIALQKKIDEFIHKIDS